MAEFKCCTHNRRWITRPEQRGWLVLGFGFYIITATRQQNLHVVSISMLIHVDSSLEVPQALRSLWALLVRLCQRMLYIRVEVSRYVSTVLFEAKRDSDGKFSTIGGLLKRLKSLWKSPFWLRIWLLYFAFLACRILRSASFSWEALTDFLAKEAEMQGLTCSWDQEALQEQLN